MKRELEKESRGGGDGEMEGVVEGKEGKVQTVGENTEKEMITEEEGEGGHKTERQQKD